MTLLSLARPSKAVFSDEFTALLATAGPEERPIRSRCQHAAVPTWHGVRPIGVCEVAYTVLDSGKWLRHAASFVRWRFDKSPEDCRIDQLA
jgi:ATP-dependent DNA ligase